MRRTVWTGASLMVLAACSGSSDVVGENSPGSIKTTATGNVVGTIPSPTPTPTPTFDSSSLNATANAADAAVTNDGGM